MQRKAAGGATRTKVRDRSRSRGMDPHLPAADIARGYKQVLEVEYQLSPKFSEAPGSGSMPLSQVAA